MNVLAPNRRAPWVFSKVLTTIAVAYIAQNITAECAPLISRFVPCVRQPFVPELARRRCRTIDAVGYRFRMSFRQGPFGREARPTLAAHPETESRVLSIVPNLEMQATISSISLPEPN